MAMLHLLASTVRSSGRRLPTVVCHARNVSSTSSHTRSSLLRLGLYATAVTITSGLFVIYYLDSRSAVHRYVLTPLVRHALDAETGHRLAVNVLKSGLGPRDPVPDDERIKCTLWDQQLANPIGLAAGFDKDGEAIDGLFNLGFSWVEIGSVTPKPQAGNAKPRVFHLMEDSALINRYGFPSRGHAFVLSRLRARLPSFPSNSPNMTAALRSGSLLAVNLGKNKESSADSIDDFLAGVRTFGPYSDVLVVNVSSPNTPGLRGLQNRDALETLLSRVGYARDQLQTYKSRGRPRLLLKIAPDLDEAQLADIADVVINSNIDGVIVSNTTISRPSSLRDANKAEAGGLSGTPLKQLSLAALKTLRRHLPSSIPLIGCGGISTGADVLEYAKAGASFVQVYTAFGYDGPGCCRRIKDELVRELEREGTTWDEVVRKAVERSSLKAEVSERDVEREDNSTAIAVKVLIKEAEELRDLLDRLDERWEKDRSPKGMGDVVEASGLLRPSS